MDLGRSTPVQDNRKTPSTKHAHTATLGDDHSTGQGHAARPASIASTVHTDVAPLPRRDTPPLPPSPPPMPPQVDGSTGIQTPSGTHTQKMLKTTLWDLAQNLLEARPSVQRDPPPNAYQPTHTAMVQITNYLAELSAIEDTAWTAAQTTKADPSIFKSQASALADKARGKLLVLSNQLDRVPAGGNYAILTPTHARAFQWIATRDRRAVVAQALKVLAKPEYNGAYRSNYSKAIRMLNICNVRWQNLFFEEYSLPAENPSATARSSAEIAASTFVLPSNEFAALNRPQLQALTPEIAEKMQQQHLRERLDAASRAAKQQPRPSVPVKSVRAVAPPNALRQVQPSGAKPKEHATKSLKKDVPTPSVEELGQCHTSSSPIWSQIQQLNTKQQQQQPVRQEAHASTRVQQKRPMSHVLRAGFESIVDDIAGPPARPPSVPRIPATAPAPNVIAARTRSRSTDTEAGSDAVETTSSRAQHALDLLRKKKPKKQPRK